jgi:hypothetical protein
MINKVIPDLNDIRNRFKKPTIIALTQIISILVKICTQLNNFIPKQPFDSQFKKNSFTN